MSVHRFTTYAVIGTSLETGETELLAASNDKDTLTSTAAEVKGLFMALTAAPALSDEDADKIIASARSIRIVDAIVVVNEQANG